jgi:hypothetical protein
MVLAMAPLSNRTDRAGGALLAGAILAGTVIGYLAGQPSVGLLCGLAVGLALLAYVWFAGRRAR